MLIGCLEELKEGWKLHLPTKKEVHRTATAAVSSWKKFLKTTAHKKSEEVQGILQFQTYSKFGKMLTDDIFNELNGTIV